MRPPRAALISLEEWDETWRRNQHLGVELVRQRLVSELLFLEPPVLGSPSRTWSPEQGITVHRPSLCLPKRAGGLRLVGRQLLASRLSRTDVLWVNDPDLGVHCLSERRPAVYDVTDDWREFHQPARVKRRLVAAEDRLSSSARTVVCSSVLQDRWRQRYSVEAAIVHNGVDVAGMVAAEARTLDGLAPHVGYVGTIHDQRVDVPLLLEIARSPAIGTLHLVGPNLLGPESSRALGAVGARLHGAVPAQDVPAWLTSLDVLISPHLVSDFTLSLDAIKSYEYLASGRPVVATPSSGFQALVAPALTVTDRAAFVEEIANALSGPAAYAPERGASWALRAQDFAQQLAAAAR